MPAAHFKRVEALRWLTVKLAELEPVLDELVALGVLAPDGKTYRVNDANYGMPLENAIDCVFYALAAF